MYRNRWSTTRKIRISTKNDELKDKLLKENGWEVLRIKWKDMFHNPKLFIQKAKDFIDAIIV